MHLYQGVNTPLKKKQNFSKKRQAILEVIRGTDIHPTAEWVYQTLKSEYPDLSLGTVYRNIAFFERRRLGAGGWHHQRSGTTGWQTDSSRSLYL